MSKPISPKHHSSREQQTVQEIKQIINDFGLDHDDNLTVSAPSATSLSTFFASLMGGIKMFPVESENNHFQILFIPREQDLKSGKYKFNTKTIAQLDLYVEKDGTSAFPLEQAETAETFTKSYPRIYHELDKISERASRESEHFLAIKNS